MVTVSPSRALALVAGVVERRSVAVRRQDRLLPGADGDPSIGLHVVDVGVIFAVGQADAGRRCRALAQLDVDDAGDRVRAILRGGAVAQHLDPRQIAMRRDQVHVDRGAAAADRAVDVEQRRDVAALAVDQHQGLVGAEAAQGRRANDVGAVGDRRLREVEATAPAGSGSGWSRCGRCWLRLSAEMTSTGTGLSATVRSVRRVPVTMIVSRRRLSRLGSSLRRSASGRRPGSPGAKPARERHGAEAKRRSRVRDA